MNGSGRGSESAEAKGVAILQRWWDLKQKIKELQKEDAALREKFKAYLTSRSLTNVRYKDFRITYRETSRESLSKKNCPPEIWKKYCTKSKYPIIQLEYLGASVSDDPEDVE